VGVDDVEQVRGERLAAAAQVEGALVQVVVQSPACSATGVRDGGVA
jgi:hypothetical protein